MEQINVLYNNINYSSFDFVIIDGNKYKINKVLDFLKNIKNGCYNDNNIIKFYKKDGIDKIKRALYKARKKSYSIDNFLEYMYRLNKILFTPISNSQEENTRNRIKTDKAKSFKDQKGKGCVNLPIALSKIYTNNSSKELTNDIKNLLNHLHDTKQITKQVYNNLIKAISYKNNS